MIKLTVHTVHKEMQTLKVHVFVANFLYKITDTFK